MSNTPVIHDEAIRAAVEELGGASREYKPSAGRMLFGYAFGAVLMIGAIALAFGMPLFRGESWFWLLAMLLAPLGYLVILYIRAISGTRIYVCQNGIVHSNGTQAEAFAWNRVVKIEQSVMSSNLPVHGVVGRVPVGELSTYQLTRDDGEMRGFNRETVSDARSLAEHVAQQAELHNIAWEIVHDD